jgi:AcrR family transcriptional regulator
MTTRTTRAARDTRNLLIAAAADLLDQGGPEAVTLRDVGKRAGVSHNAPYKHFANKEELLAAVASRELAGQVQAVAGLDRTHRPIELLRQTMHGYIDWAQRYPARFRLTFGAWKQESGELGAAATAARGKLIATVKAAQKAGELPSGNAERLASLILSLAHGACDLALGGHLSKEGKGGADPDMLVNDLIDLLHARRPKKRGKSA